MKRRRKIRESGYYSAYDLASLSGYAPQTIHRLMREGVLQVVPRRVRPLLVSGVEAKRWLHFISVRSSADRSSARSEGG